MADVRAGDVDRVIVLEVSRLTRSMRDLATTVETIVDDSAIGLHILDMNLALELGDNDPYQRAFLNIMGTIAQLEADMIRERIESGESNRSTARFAGVSRSTVGRILDGTDLYREFDLSSAGTVSESLAGD